MCDEHFEEDLAIYARFPPLTRRQFGAVSVGAGGIDWNLPQIWRTGHADDAKLLTALATPIRVTALLTAERVTELATPVRTTELS